MQRKSSLNREGKNTTCTSHVRGIPSTQRPAQKGNERYQQKIQRAGDFIRVKTKQNGRFDKNKGIVKHADQDGHLDTGLPKKDGNSKRNS